MYVSSNSIDAGTFEQRYQQPFCSNAISELPDMISQKNTNTFENSHR